MIELPKNRKCQAEAGEGRYRNYSVLSGRIDEILKTRKELKTMRS